MSYLQLIQMKEDSRQHFLKISVTLKGYRNQWHTDCVAQLNTVIERIRATPARMPNYYPHHETPIVDCAFSYKSMLVTIYIAYLRDIDEFFVGVITEDLTYCNIPSRQRFFTMIKVSCAMLREGVLSCYTLGSSLLKNVVFQKKWNSKEKDTKRKSFIAKINFKTRQWPSIRSTSAAHNKVKHQ